MQADMTTKVAVPGYEWSTDYDLALSLLDRGCLYGEVLYDHGMRLFDACRLRRGRSGGWEVGVRGIQYFDARDAEEFKALCSKYEVRFILPIPTSADLEKWEALKKTLAECLDSLELLRDAEYGDDTSDAWDCIEPGRKALAALGGGKERENV